MPTWDEFKSRRDWEVLERLRDTRLLLVDRPLLLHDQRSEPGPKCPCGCDSVWAHAVEEREHLQVLIDPLSGARVERSKAADPQEYEELAALAKRIYLPRRVSRKQLEALACGARIFGLFGGVRFGKTAHAGEETCDEWCTNGGHGAQIWWVAPTLEKTQIGLNKLALGDLVGKGKERREVAPIFPRELITHIPTSPKSDKKYIELLDGTRIWLKYASRDGGNLKGEAPIFVVGDEWAEVREESNFKQVLDRIAESKGRFFLSTTPKAGSHLKDRVFTAGQEASAWDGKHQIAYLHATCYDNPWFPPDARDELVASYGDDKQAIRREIHGEWVGDGPLLWAHFDEGQHVVHYDGYRIEEWGLQNVTRFAMGHFFRGLRLNAYGGMDFDINPMSLAAIQIGCPPGLDPQNSKNWIFCQYDELVERCPTIHKFCDRMRECGFTGLPIVTDASAAQFSPYRHAHGVDTSSTHTRELTAAGFPAKACNISDSGNPKNPPVLDRCNVAHKLMRETIEDRDGNVWPRYLIHERCKRTIDSHRTQESDEYGKPIKEPGTESDRLSGPTDAETYGMWPAFKREYYGATEWRTH